jgi:hypothetical protein
MVGGGLPGLISFLAGKRLCCYCKHLAGGHHEEVADVQAREHRLRLGLVPLWALCFVHSMHRRRGGIGERQERALSFAKKKTNNVRGEIKSCNRNCALVCVCPRSLCARAQRDAPCTEYSMPHTEAVTGTIMAIVFVLL